MEFTIAWLWAIKLALFVLAAFIVYYATAKKNLKSTFWNIVSVIVIILAIVSPIKIDGTNKSVYQDRQNAAIVESKKLPEKVAVKSWQKISTDGISKEDLK